MRLTEVMGALVPRAFVRTLGLALACICLVAALFAPRTAHAFPSFISSSAWSPAAATPWLPGCPNCHGGGVAASGLTLNGTTLSTSSSSPTNFSVSTGSFIDFTFVYTNSNGAAAAKGGFLAMHMDTSNDSGGQLSANGNAETMELVDTGNNTEVSHSGPQARSGTTQTFRFRYTAPGTAQGTACGTYGFAIWANAENGDGLCGPGGDGPSVAFFQVTVSCANIGPCANNACSSTGHGTCDFSNFSASTTCRFSTGECDPAEQCTGGSAACPGDAKTPNGTGCTDDGNPCTLDHCDGANAACQHPAGNAGATCRAASPNGCDVPETCNGSATCPNDAFQLAGTQCRAANGACDVAESCTGNSNVCPPDNFRPASFQCSPPSCTTVGGTDFQTPASFCPGNQGGACPAVSQQSCGGALCSGSACAGSCADDSTCAAGNYCSPTTSKCVPKLGNGTSCSANNQCSTGNCVDTVCCDKACGGNNSADCQACNLQGSVGICKTIPASTVCRASLGGCDPAEVCDGSATTCPADQKRPNGFVCRAAGGNTCDVDETCDGTAVACPADKRQPAGTVCRAVAGVCDVAESCDGTSPTCPTDKFVASTTVCRAVAGDCDVAENCTGSAAQCPPDKFALASVVCRQPTCTNGTATKIEHCTGSATTCPGLETSQCAPFACAATNCFGGSCSANAICDADNFCDPMTQNCIAKKSPGAQCANSGECAGSGGGAGHCVDGYCCDTTCTDQCEACNVPNKLGTCSPTTGDPVGSRPPCQSDGSQCGGSCDGKLRNRCTYPSSGTSCRDASCSSGVATEGAFCDGRGACPPEFTQTCPAACVGSGCGNDCSVDGDCPLDSFCASGICLKKRPNSQTCPSDSACVSGSCVDGYCCNESCTGQCQACDVVGKEGKCSPVAANEQPHGARAGCTSDGSVCGGSCDGAGTTSCGYPGATASCRDASCTGGIATLAGTCSGDGRCPATQEVACSPAACNAAGTRCNGGCTSNANCQATEWCAAGKCISLLDGGAACSADSQCSQGFDSKGHCVDGVCCTTACTGQCEACDLPTLEGICTTLPSGYPHGGRPACVGSGACGGACLGTSATECGLPGAQTACGTSSCSNGVGTDAAVCNGTGSCLTPATHTCAPYACGTNGCNASCTTAADCATGFECNSGTCGVPMSSGGAAGAAGSSGSAGAGASGTAGVGTSGSAGSGPDAGVVDQTPPAQSKDKGGCGCRVPENDGSPAGAAWLAALALGVATLRRKPRRTA